MKKKSYFSACLLAIGLQACSTENSGVHSSTAQGAAAGAVAGAVVGSVTHLGVPLGAGAGAVIGGWFGYVLSQHQGAADILGAYDVSIMRFGDEVVLVIPSDRLFDGYSIQLSASGQSLLAALLSLLQPMNKVTVNIAAYAASSIQTEKDLFLTQKQAETISNYLWDHALDARLFTAVGYGGGHPIQYTPNRVLEDVRGYEENYRVQISLKDYSA